MKQKTKRNLRIASPLFLPPAVGAATWKISDHLRTRDLKQKKLELQIKLDQVKAKPEKIKESMTADMAFKIYSKNLKSGNKDMSQNDVLDTLQEPDFLNEFGNLLASESHYKLKAEKEAEQIETEIQQIESQIGGKQNLAKVDGIIGGSLTILPVALWLLVHKFNKTFANLGQNIKEAIEGLKVLRKMRKEGLDIDDISEEVRKKKREALEKKEPAKLKKDKRKKRMSPSKQIQKKLYDALQPHIGDDAGALSKAIVTNLGKNTAQKIIDDPSISYDILCANADRLNVYLDKRAVDIGKILTTLERSFAEYSEDFEPIEVTAEMEELMKSLSILNDVKVSSGMKTSELRKIITDAGFIIDNKKGRGGGHSVILYVDSEGNEQFVRSSDGRVRSFPNPKESVETVAVSEIIKICSQNLEQRIEELKD